MQLIVHLSDMVGGGYWPYRKYNFDKYMCVSPILMQPIEETVKNHKTYCIEILCSVIVLNRV